MKRFLHFTAIVMILLIVSCGSDNKETDDSDSGNTGNTGDVADTGDSGNTGDTGNTSEDEEPFCGDGVIDEEAGEICDSNEIECSSIEGKDYISGKALCNDSCDGFDESECFTEVCGDETISGEEVCDGNSIACTEIEGKNYDEGTATCNDSCDGWIEDECVDYCGNGEIDEGEICEIGDTMECNDIKPHGYKLGETTWLEDCSGWDEETCQPVEKVPVYGHIYNMVVSEYNIADAEKIYPLKDPSDPDSEREFDSQYVLNNSQQDPDINGEYANGSRVILTKPGSFLGFGQKRQIVANKGIDPLPEKLFTLFASIEAKSFLELDDISLKGPQVVLMFNSENITAGDYLIGPTGPEDVVIAVGEEMPDSSGDDIDIADLCIAAIAFDSEDIHVDMKVIEVVDAINPMQEGGGGAIAYNGHDLPLYHPTETPIGDVSEIIKDFGLENICPKQ
ncbi:MAG: hypothetical protein R6W70_02870 [bacterium]